MFNINQNYGKSCFIKLPKRFFAERMELPNEPPIESLVSSFPARHRPSAGNHDESRTFPDTIFKLSPVAQVTGRRSMDFARFSIIAIFDPPPTMIAPAGRSSLLFIFFK